MSFIRTGVYPHMPIAISANSLQHWLSLSKRWPVSHTTHGPRLSSQVCRTWLTIVQRIIDFSVFGSWGLTPGLTFSKRGDDLLATQVYHPTKFHSPTSTCAGDIHYQKSCGQRKKQTSTPVVRTGIYPHMPIAAHCKIQTVYNTGHHGPCSGQFFTPHTAHGCPASLSHQANDRRTCYRFCNFWPWGVTPGPRFTKRGDDLLST